MGSFDSRDVTGASCAECGAAVAEGQVGCQKLFDEVHYKGFDDYRYAKLHRLTIDTYALQHPRWYMRSGKSFAAHLTGTCAALEYDETAVLNQALQRWLNGPKVVERPGEPSPRKRGELTIVYVHGAADAEEHARRVWEWARSTWDAWGAYHDLARRWIDRATSESPRRSKSPHEPLQD